MTTYCQLLYGSNISAFISHDAKKGALWSCVCRDSSTHVPRAFTNSTTAIFEVYVAFLPALSRKVWKVSPPQLTNSTSLSRLVVCAMWRWARKWVHQIKALIAFLFCSLWCSPTFWSWLIMDPSFLALSASTSNWQDRRYTSLFECDFIFLVAFFQLVNGLIIQGPPVFWRNLPPFFHDYIMHP